MWARKTFYTIYNEAPLITGGTVTPVGGNRCLAGRDRHQHRRRDQLPHQMGISTGDAQSDRQHGAGAIDCCDPGIHQHGRRDRSRAGYGMGRAPPPPAAALLFMSCKTTSIGHLPLGRSGDRQQPRHHHEPFLRQHGGRRRSDNTFLSNLWEQATAQGETVVVSAGDAGSANSADQNQYDASPWLAVNGFASTAYNVAAGGTDFQDYYNQLESDTAFGRSHYWNSSNGTATPRP